MWITCPHHTEICLVCQAGGLRARDDKIHSMMYIISRVVRMVRSGAEYTLLTAAFFLGIGITALTLRVFGVRLMERESADSTWTDPSGSTHTKRMY